MAFDELKREKRYQGQVFDVAKVYVRLSDGRERDYDLVEHADSVSILPLNDEGQIIFVSQDRMGSGGALLELPAGVQDPGEKPIASAERELREEIGKGAGKMDYLGGFFLAPGYSDEYMTVFLATNLYDAPLAADEYEMISLEPLSVKEAYKRARSGEIKDGKTLAALFLAQPYLEGLY